MYVGPLALDDLHHNVFLINSGVIKILTRELGIKLDDCDDFLISAITEALVYEWNTEKGHVPNPEFSKVIKYPNTGHIVPNHMISQEVPEEAAGKACA